MEGREGYDDPKRLMTARRAGLLLLGICGGVLSAVALYIVVSGSLMVQGAPPASTKQPAETGIQLPVQVAETSLLAERLSAYEGPFLEDGSDKEVVDVAALHVRNTGEQELRKVCVKLQFYDTAYVFYGEHIPPGVTVVLLEMDEKPYQNGSIIHCTGWQEIETREQLTGIAVMDRAMGSLVVTNLTDTTYENVCLYYKTWLSPPDIYIGGITYTVKIPVLLPGRTLYLYPYHYAVGYSKLVSVIADG